MNLVKEEWTSIGQWVQPTLSACFWNRWSFNDYPFSIGRLDGRLPVLYGHHFVYKKDLRVLRQFLLDNIDNFEILEKLEKWINQMHENSVRGVMNFPEELVGIFNEFTSLYKQCTDVWIFCLVLSDVLEEEFSKFCSEKGLDFAEISSQIKPLHKPLAVKLEEDAIKLYRKMKGLSEETEFRKEINEHVSTYKFCGVHHFVGEPYTVEKFWEGFERHTTIPKEVKWYAKLASILAYGRFHGAETSGLLQYSIKKHLVKASERLGVGEDYIWLTMNEIISGLEGEFVKPNIEQRKMKVGVYSVDGKEIVVAASEVDVLLSEMVSEEKGSWPLKGRVACRGVVKGIAKIVVNPEDIHKVEVGDILFAPETTPDLIMGMKKVAGIVTNRGGITSHAAIVSREFGIPCIIGTKFGTSLVRDGELVELDGFTGEVKKI